MNNQASHYGNTNYGNNQAGCSPACAPAYRPGRLENDDGIGCGGGDGDDGDDDCDVDDDEDDGGRCGNTIAMIMWVFVISYNNYLITN